MGSLNVMELAFGIGNSGIEFVKLFDGSQHQRILERAHLQRNVVKELFDKAQGNPISDDAPTYVSKAQWDERHQAWKDYEEAFEKFERIFAPVKSSKSKSKPKRVAGTIRKVRINLHRSAIDQLIYTMNEQKTLLDNAVRADVTNALLQALNPPRTISDKHTSTTNYTQELDTLQRKIGFAELSSRLVDRQTGGSLPTASSQQNSTPNTDSNLDNNIQKLGLESSAKAETTRPQVYGGATDHEPLLQVPNATQAPVPLRYQADELGPTLGEAAMDFVSDMQSSTSIREPTVTAPRQLIRRTNSLPNTRVESTSNPASAIVPSTNLVESLTSSTSDTAGNILERTIYAITDAATSPIVTELSRAIGYGGLSIAAVGAANKLYDSEINRRQGNRNACIAEQVAKAGTRNAEIAERAVETGVQNAHTAKEAAMAAMLTARIAEERWRAEREKELSVGKAESQKAKGKGEDDDQGSGCGEQPTVGSPAKDNTSKSVKPSQNLHATRCLSSASLPTALIRTSPQIVSRSMSARARLNADILTGVDKMLSQFKAKRNAQVQSNGAITINTDRLEAQIAAERELDSRLAEHRARDSVSASAGTQQRPDDSDEPCSDEPAYFSKNDSTLENIALPQLPPKAVVRTSPVREDFDSMYHASDEETVLRRSPKARRGKGHDSLEDGKE